MVVAHGTSTVHKLMKAVHHNTEGLSGSNETHEIMLRWRQIYLVASQRWLLTFDSPRSRRCRTAVGGFYQGFINSTLNI